MARSTASLASKTSGPRDRQSAWGIAIALDRLRPATQAERISFGSARAVEIGRGERRATRHEQGVLRIDLDDTATSQSHVRLVLDGESWSASDAGSKNGTRLNGRPLDRGVLGDGDVIECGNTYLVIRRDVPAAADPRGTLGIPTISTLLERELAPLAKIAVSAVPVLLRGETGTGKDVVACAVHEYSRRSGRLVTVNCAAIPPALLEGELFGSRRGAFSGAEDRAGLAASAERGTLFLDEIGELTPPSQAALLRFLQDGEVLPLGAGKSMRLDVRVIAATNRTIEEHVASGAFRRDLYARLRGYEVRLPPLRQRREDLGILVAELLRRHDAGARSYSLARAAARALFQHPWPFNVRELEQAIRTAVTLVTNDEIELDDLHLETPGPTTPATPATNRDNLLALLHEHHGNVSAVARALSTSRSQVLRLLARASIDPAEYKS